jgi:hypothetical protein
MFAQGPMAQGNGITSAKNKYKKRIGKPHLLTVGSNFPSLRRWSLFDHQAHRLDFRGLSPSQ